VMGLAARAEDRGRPGQWATQLGAEWRADRFELGANYIDIDPAFNAGLGYVRVRERMTGVRGSLKPRPGRWGVRQFEITPSTVWYHDANAVLRSRESNLTLAAAFQSGDFVAITPFDSYERIVRPFPIGSGVTLPPGEYRWRGVTTGLRSYNGRRASANVSISVGDFYDGNKNTVAANADLRPSRTFSFNPSYQINDVRLSRGAFVTHLFGLRANVSFSTSLLTSAFVQYNSAGQLAATQVRLNYIFRGIDNIYLVYNDSRFTAGVFDGRSNRSLVLKATYSVHR
jgi:hypothetical protein